jgi:hypothetical protein
MVTREHIVNQRRAFCLLCSAIQKNFGPFWVRFDRDSPGLNDFSCSQVQPISCGVQDDRRRRREEHEEKEKKENAA